MADMMATPTAGKTAATSEYVSAVCSAVYSAVCSAVSMELRSAEQMASTTAEQMDVLWVSQWGSWQGDRMVRHSAYPWVVLMASKLVDTTASLMAVP